jgi:hypothetical protein
MVISSSAVTHVIPMIGDIDMLVADIALWTSSETTSSIPQHDRGRKEREGSAS